MGVDGANGLMSGGPKAHWVVLRHLLLSASGVLSGLLFGEIAVFLAGYSLHTDGAITAGAIGGGLGFATSVLLPLDDED